MQGGDSLNKYIPLNEATKFCNYSQEYLSLRARQGKLKAVKFGRNWVTKTEWLEEYLGQVDEYNIVHENLGNKKLGVVPDNLPIELARESDDQLISFPKFPKLNIPVSGLRIGFLAALAFSLLLHNVVFGKENLKNVLNEADNYVGEMGSLSDKFAADSKESFKSVFGDIDSFAGRLGDKTEKFFAESDQGLKNVSGDLSLYTYILGNGADEFLTDSGRSLANVYGDLKNIDLGLAEAGKTADGNLKKYSFELSQKIFGVGQRIVNGYKNTNRVLEEGLKNLAFGIKDGYWAANNSIEQKISKAWQKVKGLGEFAVSPWKNIIPGTVLESGDLVTKTQYESLEKEVGQLKENGLIVKEITREVTRVTQIEPIKEITRETVRLDEKSLGQVRAQIVELQDAVSKRLYAPGGVISQQIYITQPVSSPKVYQENGDIVFQTVGTGNVIMSAATGMQISGKQVVIDSTSVSNPLVYIADKTEIAGDTAVGGSITAQKLILSADPAFTGNIVDVKSGSNSKFSITSSGATLVGSLTVTGNFTNTGSQTFNGVLAISSSTASTILTVTQNGTGNIVDFKDGSNSVFTIADGGYAQLAVSASTTPSFVIKALDTSWTAASSTYLAIAASSTFNGRFIDFQKAGTSQFYVDGYGNLEIFPSTPILRGSYQSSTYLDQVRAVTVSGNYAYLITESGGAGMQYLVIVDISNPASPAFVGFYSGEGLGNRLSGSRTIQVVGKYAYVAVSNDGLEIFDVSNPSAPSYVGAYLQSGVRGVYIAGKYAYLADATNHALRVVDISNPVSPILVGSYASSTILNGANAVQVSGRYAYVAASATDTLAIIDVSDPASPTFTGSYTSSNYLDGPSISSVYVSGRYAYVTGYSTNTLAIIDVATPTAPVLVGSYTDATYLNGPYGVQVSGKYAYVANYTSNTLTILDVSNPALPTYVTSYQNSNYVNPTGGFSVVGKYIYTTSYSNDALAVLEIPGLNVPAANIGDLVASTLDVTDDALIQNNLFVQNGLSVGAGGIYSQGSMGIFASSSATSTALTINQSGTGDIFNIYDGANEVFTVVDGGKVGIATSSPRDTLEVWGGMYVGTSTAPTFYIASSTGRVAIGTSSPDTLFTIATSTNILNVTTGGYVGIGKGNYTYSGFPAHPLDLMASSSGATPIVLALWNSGTGSNSGSSLGFQNTGYAWGAFITSKAPDGTGTSAGDLLLQTRQPNATYNNFYFDQWGSVGFGTTSPASAFEIYSATNTNAQLTISAATSSTYDAQIAFRTGASSPTTRFVLGVDQSANN
ncbi:MAG: hypothetical protein Q7S70_01010, partial [bacterium]|nr:hypothetical protein [bacterium]